MNHEKPIIKNKEWIGRIPSDWDFVKIKEHFVERNTKVDDTSFPPLSVSMGGVVDQMENVSKSDNSGNRKLVKKNDFVINSRSDRKGSSGISPRDGSVSLINIVLKPKNINSKYSEYLFKSYYFKEEFFRNGKGIHFDLWSTRYELMKQIFIPYPKIEEQNKIVEYLDNETHQIEKLIKKIEQKIELLKEQRTSLINEVVTKGLNPNVEMKESGVEWIGEIPSHWDVVKLKYLSKITPSSVDKHIFDDEIQVSVCNYTHVYYNDFINTKVGLDVGSCTENEFLKFRLHKDDVIITKDSETPDDIGIPTLVSESLENTVCGYHLTIIRPKGIKGEYLFRFILSERTRRYFEIHSNGVTRFGLGKPSVENLVIPLPPEEEQEKIITHLGNETQIIDDLISNEHKRTELLKEYKQSLISEVVTGKKRVV